jgi:hypothetical protein
MIAGRLEYIPLLFNADVYVYSGLGALCECLRMQEKPPTRRAVWLLSLAV